MFVHITIDAARMEFARAVRQKHEGAGRMKEIYPGG